MLSDPKGKGIQASDSIMRMAQYRDSAIRVLKWRRFIVCNEPLAVIAAIDEYRWALVLAAVC